MGKFVFIFSAVSVFLILLLGSVHGAPKNSKEEYFAWHYLRDYHYLSARKDGNHDMKTGLKMFQKFFNLPVTGELDRATVTAMHKPRCGVPDLEDETTERRKRFVVFGSKWKKSSLTYAFESYTDDVGQPLQEQIIAQAFSLWSNASNLSFHQISDHTSADLKIRFVKGDHSCSMPFDGPGSILAHAFFPEIGNLHFDDDETYTDGTDSGTNLLAVAAHEIGHLLGIEHSRNQGSVMRSAYSGYDPNFSLHKDDIDAIRHLYGGGNNVPEITPTSNPCKDLSSACGTYTNLCSSAGMIAFCKKTCGLCGGGQAVAQCTNSLGDQLCTAYEQAGICGTNKGLMEKHCMLTCFNCVSPSG